MGANTAKMQADLIQRVTDAKARLESNQITLNEARDILSDVSGQVSRELTGSSLEAVRSKLLELDRKIAQLERLEKETKEQRQREQLAGDAAGQRRQAFDISNLTPLYSREYGPDNAVAALLQAGNSNGGFRIPREGLDLDRIAADVHYLACKGGGFSSPSSTSNGLVNRIREQCAGVVTNAHKAGYPVGDKTVQEAMAVLAREIAYTLDSDSGGREEKDEHLARGMSYQPGTKAPGLDPQLSKVPFSDDPQKIREDRERALIALRLQLNTANGERRTRLLAQIEKIEKELRKR